jgi:hypothetical protein
MPPPRTCRNSASAACDVAIGREQRFAQRVELGPPTRREACASCRARWGLRNTSRSSYWLWTSQFLVRAATPQLGDLGACDRDQEAPECGVQVQVGQTGCWLPLGRG